MFFLGGVCLLWVVAFDLRRLCAGVTHPRPLSRGEVLDADFFLIISGLLCWNSPLERGGLESSF